MASNVQRRLISLRDAAAMLGRSEWTMYSWASKGRIASHKVGSRVMFTPEEIDRIIAESERPRVKVVA